MRQEENFSFVRQYHFYKKKYGDELLVDVVELKDIKNTWRLIRSIPCGITTLHWLHKETGISK